MKRRIRNPFRATVNDGCFACGERNPCGLQMEFYEEGEEVVSIWTPRPDFIGYGGVLHGGIQSTLMDEIAAWAIFVKLQTGGVTQRLDVSFLRPLRADKGAVTVLARKPVTGGRVAEVPVEIVDGDGRLCTKATVTYRIFPEKLARAKLGYPGVEAFFDSPIDSAEHE